MARADYGNPPVPYTEGVVVNPNGTSNFAVDTGALSGGIYEVTLVAGGTVASVFTLQHRNAANSANVRTHTVFTPDQGTGQYSFNIKLEANERLRVLPSAVTGSVAASVILESLM